MVKQYEFNARLSLYFLMIYSNKTSLFYNCFLLNSLIEAKINSAMVIQHIMIDNVKSDADFSLVSNNILLEERVIGLYF